jgi:photosystem II stability/assembly factor-like uncharacterized protein
MTLLDEGKVGAEEQAAEALFKEARQRRHRRWLVSGLVALALLLIGIGIGVAESRGGGIQTTSGGSGTGTPTLTPIPRTGKNGAVRLAYTPAISTGAAGGAVWMANGSGLYLTTNQGKTWRTVTPPLLIGDDPGYRIGPMVGVGTSDLWLPLEDVPGLAESVPGLIPPGSASVRGSGIDRSTNGGQSWAFTPLPGCVQACGASISLSFTDAEHGFASIGPDQAGVNALFSTSDGGTTWSRVGTLPGTSGARIAFANDADGWMVNATVFVGGGGQAGAMFQTTDGGVSWEQTTGLPESDLYQEPAFFGEDGVVLGVARGDSSARSPLIFTTDDGGSSWTSHRTPSNRASGKWTSVGSGIPFSASSRTDWSLFVGPELYSTVNAGETWRRFVPRPTWQPGQMQSLVFTAANDGWAVTQLPGCEVPHQTAEERSQACYPVLMASTDGGKHWSPRNP